MTTFCAEGALKARENEKKSEFYLLGTVPAILRARGFRLYARGGGRLVDLWQNNGAAVLGHAMKPFLRELKNAASRGLYAPFPHFAEGRLKNALSKIFHGRAFKIYNSPPSAASAFLENKTASLWRPFLNEKSPFEAPKDAPDILIPVIPGIQGWREGLPQGLCVFALSAGSALEKTLPAGDFLPPAALAAAARGAHDILASASRAKTRLRKVEAALQKSPWRRRGIYLSLKEAPGEAAWEALFARFLAAGFLLPPAQDHPLILPGILSPGEEAKLAEVLKQEP